MSTRRIVGQVRALRIAQTGVGFRVPDEWAAHHDLSLGQAVYMSGALDGSVEVHMDERPWSKTVTFRVKDRKYPILTIPSEIARTRGIAPKDDLELSVDETSGSLWLLKMARGNA